MSEVEVLALRQEVSRLRAENAMLRSKEGIAFARPLMVSVLPDMNEPIEMSISAKSITLPLQASWTLTRHPLGGLQALGMAREGKAALRLSYHSDHFEWLRNDKLGLLGHLHGNVIHQLAKEWEF